jgi:hypothetical protein
MLVNHQSVILPAKAYVYGKFWVISTHSGKWTDSLPRDQHSMARDEETKLRRYSKMGSKWR